MIAHKRERSDARMKMSKKILASLILIGLLAAAAAIGTYAWFSSTRTMNPGFYTAHLDLELNAREDWGTVLGNMAPGENGVQIFDLKSHGTTASYSELEISYEAPCLCVSNGTTEWAEVSIPVDIALEDITQLSFLKKVVQGYCGWSTAYPSGWNPNVILAIDADNDGDFDGDLLGYHFGTGIKSDAFVEGECPVGLTAYDTDFVLLGAISEMAWWGADVNGLLVDAPYGPLSGFQTQSWGEINPTDHVKFIKIVIGGSGSWMDERAYVRDIKLNNQLQTLPDIGEVITVTVEEWDGSNWVPVDPVGSTLKQWAGYTMKILDDSDGVGSVRITLHFKESAGNEYQSICGQITFTFTLWQGP